MVAKNHSGLQVIKGAIDIKLFLFFLWKKKSGV